MFELTTNRLRIIPLNNKQLELLHTDQVLLEKELKLQHASPNKLDDTLEKEISIAWKFWLEGVKRNPFNYIWYTRWEIILKNENKIIGSCGFKGLPTIEGKVEVGYMINADYQNNGYMSEALSELINYAFRHERVKTVLAETPKENYSSHKVLLNNKFMQYRETDKNFWWKLEKLKPLK